MQTKHKKQTFRSKHSMSLFSNNVFNKMFQDRIAAKGERLRACLAQGGPEPLGLRRMSSACPMPFKADGSGAVCTALAVCVETAT